MNKKGIALHVTSTIITLLIVLFSLTAFIILIGYFTNSRFSINDIQAEVLINGLLYSPGGVTYTDPISGRMYSGQVKIEQITNERLDEEFFYPENRLMAAKITIKRQNGEQIKEVYFNQEQYENWEPLIRRMNIPGLGGVTEYKRELPIIIRQNDETPILGKAAFQVIQPRRQRDE
jgi:hypothetical protein